MNISECLWCARGVMYLSCVAVITARGMNGEMVWFGNVDGRMFASRSWSVLNLESSNAMVDLRNI